MSSSTTTQPQPTPAADIGLGATALGAQKAIATAQTLTSKTKSIAQRVLYWLRCLFNRYPPLAAFFISLLATSSLPIGTFLMVTVGSLGGLLAVALTIIGLIQGGVVAFSGTILLFVLGGCGIFSLVVVTGLTVAWTGLSIARGAYRMVTHVLSGRKETGPRMTQERWYPTASYYGTTGGTAFVPGTGAAQEVAQTYVGQKLEETRQVGSQVRQATQEVSGSGTPSYYSSGPQVVSSPSYTSPTS